MKRGVVAAPAILHRIPGGFTVERNISAEELRFYILYWDRVVIPGNNLVYIGVPDEQELVASGAIARPRVQYSGNFKGDQVANAVIGCQSLVAAKLAKESDIDWVMHQFGGDMLTLPGFAQDTAALRIAVASVLPVPPADVPIGDVLEFKERKQKDLSALHDCLDALYLDILRTPDRNLGSRKLIGELRDQISGLNSGEVDTAGWKKFDLSVEFNMKPKDIILGLAGGAGVAATAGWLVPLGAAVGAIASLVEVKMSKTSTVGAEKHRLGYLTSARKEHLLP